MRRISDMELATGRQHFHWRQAWEKAMDIGAISARENPERSFEYQQRAAECRALALDVCNEGSREELLAIADVWMTLAETRGALRH